MVAPIQANTWEIGGFLSAHQVTIPALQRPYAWERQQAEDLVNDLENIVRYVMQPGFDNAPVPQHFFGTIVLLDQRGINHVIDGQQRLTTVSCLLSVIEHAFRQVAIEAQHLGAPDQVARNCIQMAEQIRGKLWVEGPMDSKGRLVLEPRLQVSKEISKFYQDVLDGKQLVKTIGLPTGARNLINNVEFLGKFVKNEKYFKGEPVDKFRYLRAVYRSVTSGLIVVTLKTSSPDSGYDLFESLNARGEELNVLDLLKVWMMSRLAESDCPEEFMATAASSLEELSRGDVAFQKTFFDHYFRARALLNTAKKPPKALAIDTRRLIFNDPVLQGKPDLLSIYERIMSEIARMDRWRPIAKDLENDYNSLPSCIQFPIKQDGLWTSRRILHLKKTLKHTGVLMPLLLISSDVLRSDPNRFTDLVHILEKFFFRYKTMCGGPVKKIEDAYYGFMRVLEANGTIDLHMVRTTLDKLIQQHANDALFSQRIGERLTYANAPLVKYALHTIHLYGLPPNPKKDPAGISDWWIEHIAPQNPNGTPAVSPELTHTLGNLCLLNPEINKTLSNLSFDAKKLEIRKLQKQNKNIDVHDTLLVFSDSQKTWLDDDVKKRQNRLTQRLIQIYTL